MARRETNPVVLRDPVWERQPNETDQAFEAFAIYRDLGVKRSLAKVGKRLGKSLPLMERWSRRWSWVERAAEWDRELDRRWVEDQATERKRMARRQAQDAALVQTKIRRRFRKLDPDKEDLKVLVRAYDVAVKVERLARGEATERSEVKVSEDVGDFDPSNLTDAELAQLEALLRKGSRPEGDGGALPAKPE